MNYHIFKGNHFSNLGLHFEPLIGTNKHVEFRFKLEENCKYDLGNLDNYDLNKLFGISIGYHKNNSFRLGWRCINGVLELHRFIHVNGEMKLENTLIGPIETNTMYGGRFERERNKITLYISSIKGNNETDIYSFSQYFDTNFWFGYCLFPYFGGNMSAPHHMSMFLNFLVIK